MKKIFLLTFGVILGVSSALIAMDEDVGDPVRIRFGSKSFRPHTSWVFATLNKEHFRAVSDRDDDVNARGKREIFIDDTEIEPLLEEFQKNAHIFKSDEEYTIQVNDEIDKRYAEQYKELVAQNNQDLKNARDESRLLGFEEAQNKRSFFEKHPKKLMVGSLFVGLTTGAGICYWWHNR